MIFNLISSGFFLLVIGAVIPILAWASKKKMDEGGWAIRRLPFYGEAVAVQLVLLPLAFWCASANKIEVSFQFPAKISVMFPGFLLLAVALATMWLTWPRTSQVRRDRLIAIVPVTGAERIAWIGVSTVAAIAEETIYRGVLIGTLLGLTESWWLSAVVSSVMFGLGHLVQGWKSAGIVMVFGFSFHLLVLISETLFVAIAVHFLYDLIVGLVVGGTVKVVDPRSIDAETV